MTLSAFLSDLSAVSSLSVTFEPLWRGERVPQGLQPVFIGSIASAKTHPGPQRSPAPLILSNHGAAVRYGLTRDTSSVALAVLGMNDTYLQAFSIWSDRPLAPSAALARMHLVADDASPDSLMGVVLLLAKLANVDLETIPAAWIGAVDSWERTGNVGDPWTSWCALASALVHRHFPVSGGIRSEDLCRSWIDGLRFLAGSMLAGYSPEAMPKEATLPEHMQARGALEQEFQAYTDWLDGPARVQVSLPMQGAADRRMLVDGLIIEGEQITGSAKVFFRNDRKNAPLGMGFSFAAMYGAAAGPVPMGVTISVAPDRGCHLRELWQALEDAECEAWSAAGEGRPADNPRLMPGVANAWNQPWYIDPSGTLIGSPRTLADGTPGSLLTWEQIREVMWQACNPLRGIFVLPGLSQRVHPLLEAPPETSGRGHRRVLFAGKWVRDPGGSASLQPFPFRPSSSFGRVLAAKLAHGAAPGAPGFRDLPPLGSWATAKLSGGVAVASPHGLFVLDDWSGERLDTEAIREAFETAARLDADLQAYERDCLRPMVESLGRLLRNERPHEPADKLLLRSARLSAQLAELRGSDTLAPRGGDAALVRTMLEAQWQWKSRLERFEQEVRALETSLRSLGEMSTLRVGRFIATYGFALVLASTLAPFVAKAVYHLHHERPEEAPGKWVLYAAAALGLILLLIMKVWLAREHPLARTKSKDDSAGR